ncbi:MAG TPA: alpha/beta fold hydrolase [Jiangellales bacterium]|nr:alpha/beta fold hydrolase [Jiangellales bacterium]
MPLVPGAEPYHHDGGPVGVLLLHGLSGSPAAVRPWGQALAEAGYTVDAPRLPGHGTTWQELNMCRWPDWWAVADRAFVRLRERCERVVVGGLSFGGALALRVAEQHGAEVAGVMVVNPFLKTDDPRRHFVLPIRHLLKSYPGIINDIKKEGQDEIGYARLSLLATHSSLQFLDIVREDLPQVTQPLLHAHSLVDHTIGTIGTEVLRSRVSSTHIVDLPLPDSYHVATLDHDAPEIFRASVDFVAEVTAGVPT